MPSWRASWQYKSKKVHQPLSVFWLSFSKFMHSSKKYLWMSTNMPCSVLSIFLPPWYRCGNWGTGIVICPRLHSSYVPEPIFGPKQSRFTWQYLVLARLHSGSSAWEATAPGFIEHALVILVSDCYVEPAFEVRGRTSAHLSKASPITSHDSLHTPISSTVRSPWWEFLFPLCSHCIWWSPFITPHYSHLGVPSWEGSTVQGLRPQAL